MSQTRLFITTTKKIAEAAAGLLEIEFDAEGIPVAAFEVDETGALWSLSVYAPNEHLASIEARMTAILASQGESTAPEREVLEDADWVSRTLADLAPVRAGQFVVHGSHDRGCARAGETAIEIDAGQAFGTGHHGTTAGCLAMIDRHLRAKPVRRVLDIGTGSGVLAIALARRTRRQVLASDIDPIAVEVARTNTRLNRMHNLVECITATGLQNRTIAASAPYDLVVANILARPLQKLARDVSRILDSRATVILSGLLPHQKGRIVATYRIAGLRLEHAHLRDGWLTLVLRKGP